MSNTTLRNWLAWRDDYRCARPPVSCQGCDTYYPSEKHAAVMVFEGFNLVRCSDCENAKDENEVGQIL